MTAPGLPDELPPGALEAALAAIHQLYSHGDPCGCTEPGEHEGLIAADGDAASEAIWAAYPFIAAAERERIIKLAESEADNLGGEEPHPFDYLPIAATTLRDFAELLRQDGDTPTEKGPGQWS